MSVTTSTTPVPTSAECYSLWLSDPQKANKLMYDRNNVHSLLAAYFSLDDTVEFRKLQFTTGLLISGSTALQFFENVYYPEADLDTYVNQAHARTVAHWFISVGYEFVKKPYNKKETLEQNIASIPLDPVTSSTFTQEDEPEYDNALLILNFYSAHSKRHIQLVTTRHTPLELILSFHSSAVMNVITHNYAYSIFPDITFLERQSILFQPLTPARELLATEKYTARGFTLFSNVPLVAQRDNKSSLTGGLRYLGDDKCWIVPLFPNRKNIPSSDIKLHSWSLEYTNGLPSIKKNLVFSETLQKSYLAGNGTTEDILAQFVCDISDRTSSAITDIVHCA